MTADDPLDDLCDSVLRGEDIDWEGADTGRGLDPDTVRSLRHVAQIADFSRRLQRPSTASPDVPPIRSEPWGGLLLLEPLGAGARGEVWRAWDPTLQRQVALKFLQGSGASDDGAAWEELLAESRALARVRHRAVVAVHGIGEHGGRAGMWMECLEGTTLVRELERSGKLPEEKVVHIGMELCSALEALEGAGLVHRDIKPANVMLEASGRVVLTDFGLGWRPSLDGAASVRSSGTPLFMAPELLSGGQPSHASDLYALGVTLWWALAGRAPFGAKTLSELHAEAKRGPSLSLQEIRSDASESLVSTILWSMRPAAAERPGAASQLLERLRAVRDEIEAARRAAASASIHPASVAILPFANRSGNAEDEYFSDGLADELIHVLSKIKGIRVAARASSFHFRSKGARPAEIGRALRVATILDGSVRRVGSRVRISVQLVSAADGDSLWSESYDRAFDDLFAFQDDIARSVVRELRITLLGKPEAAWQTQSDVAKAVRGRANTPEAQRLYIHARHFVDRFNRPEMGKAIEYLREALAIEPTFALAWAELARAYAAEADAGWVPSVQAYERSREAAQRALTLDPNLAEAHVRMGRVRRNYEHDLEGAKASYAMALELDPVNATALAGAGALCMNLAQFDDAVRYYERALDRDPLNAGAHHNLGMPLLYVGRLSDAEAAFRKALELAPQTAGTRCYLSWTLQAQGRSAEALSIAQHEPEEWVRLWALAILHGLEGRRLESDAALQGLIGGYAELCTFQIAEVHAIRAESDEAFRWLERAVELHDSGLSDLSSSPRLKSLWEDARWKPFVQKVGLVL